VVSVFVIITYDVGEKRVNKVRKKLKEYLYWTQNSVFEGEITLSSLAKCMSELEAIINKNEDSIYVYEVKNPRNIKKKVYGQEKSFETLFVIGKGINLKFYSGIIMGFGSIIED
jgi:CRISPR-associated endoribonuclease Cas2